MSPLQEKIFENLKGFKNFYNRNIQWFQYKNNAEKKDFPRHIAYKLKKIEAITPKNEINCEGILIKLLKKEQLSKKELDFLYKLVELIGILLGDGSIRKYSLRIDLNRVDEAEYVNYVYNLLYEVFAKYPKKENRKGVDGVNEGKGVRLNVHGIKIINFLIKLGLKIGDKIKNEVEVPDWILLNKYLIPFALKGLFDTDGNIDINKKWRSISLRFVSGSILLVKNFKQMCNVFDIQTSNIRKMKIKNQTTNKIYDAWIVSIGSKENVSKFIDIVKPKKFLYRKKVIAMLLMIFENPEKLKILNNEKEVYFPKQKKINQFTYEYNRFLFRIFKKYRWIISDEIVEMVIKNSLKLKTHNYNIIFAKELKEFFEKYGTINEVIEFYRIKRGIHLEFHTVKKHIKRLFNEASYIEKFKKNELNPLEISGDTCYEIWNKNNSRIIVDRQAKKVHQFNSKLRLKIILEIHKFLQKLDKSNLPENELVTEHLKGLIKKSPYLKRLYLLLNDKDYSLIIVNYINILIIIVKEILNNTSKSIYQISKETGIKSDTVQMIINEIQKKNKK